MNTVDHTLFLVVSTQVDMTPPYDAPPKEDILKIFLTEDDANEYMNNGEHFLNSWQIFIEEVKIADFKLVRAK